MVKIIRQHIDYPYYTKVIMEHVIDPLSPCGVSHILHAASAWYGSSSDAAQFYPFNGAQVRLAVQMYSQLPYTLMFACQYCYGHTSGVAIPVFDIRQVTPDFRVVPVSIGDEWH